MITTNIFFKAIAVSLALVTVSVIAQTFFNIASAHSGGNDWTSGTDLDWAPNSYTFDFDKVGNYYFTDTTYMSWTSTRASALKNSGHRYTHDSTNGTSCATEHFNATGNYGTNMPNPVYDRDNDTWYCNSSNEEAEITSNNSNFPTANTNYYTTMQWERDSNGTGEMYYTAALSDYNGFMGEWNTQHYDLLYTHNYSYSGAMKQLKQMFAGLKNYVPITFAHGIVGDEKREHNINVKQNIESQDSLHQYKADAQANITELQNKGIKKARVIVTFNVPQVADDFISFMSSETIDVRTFKMRATDSSGDRITVGGVPNSDGTIDPLEVFKQVSMSNAMQALDGLVLQGVVAFEGEINIADYTALSDNPAVYFVDMTPEFIRVQHEVSVMSNTEQAIDVNVNDLYWYVEDYE